MDQFNDELRNNYLDAESVAPAGGVPDTGNGYFSQRLSYANWYMFNNWQRV